METTRSSSLLSLFLIAIFGLLLGSLAGTFTANRVPDNFNGGFNQRIGIGGAPPTGSPAPTIGNSQEESLRLELNSLFRDHSALLLMVMRQTYDNRSDRPAAEESLNNNSQKLAATIGEIYGDNTEQEFLRLWNSHNENFIQYTTALRYDDKEALNAANARLNTSPEEISNFLSKLNSRLNKELLKSQLNENKWMILNSIDAYAIDDFDMTYQKQNDVYQYSSLIADTVSDAVAQQFPDRY